MASLFSGGKGGCETVGCSRSSDVTAVYRVEENQELCRECAGSKPRAIRTRFPKDDDWYCPKHDEKPVEYYCNTHAAAVCQACAFLLHQKPCDVVDLEDVVQARRLQVGQLLTLVSEKRCEVQEKESCILRCNVGIDGHFKDVGDSITAAFGEDLDRICEKEKKECERINKGADDKISAIEESRVAELTNLTQEVNKQRKTLESKQREFMASLLGAKEKVDRKIEELKFSAANLRTSLESAQCVIDELLLSDKRLINEHEQCKTKLIQTIEQNDKLNLEQLERLAGSFDKVCFDTECHESKNGKLAGLDRSWTMTDTIAIQRDLEKPYFVGSVSTDDMVISDLATKMLYVTDLRARTTNKVLEVSSRDRTIASCVSLGSETILCTNYCRGTAEGKSFRGVSLFNKNWELIKDVDVPKRTPLDKTFACVCRAWEDGKAIVAEACQSSFQVIDPVDGSIVFKGQVDGEDNKILWIRALASGDLVVKTSNGGFVVADRQGNIRRSFQNSEWDGCLCDVDLSNDLLYIVYRDVVRGVYAVDEVSSEGTVLAGHVAEYPFSGRKDVVLPCVMTSSGKLVTCNGESFFVFQKLGPFDL